MKSDALNVSANLGGPVDRRNSTRFPVRENLKYKLFHGKESAVSGAGHTLNMGSGGLLIATEEKLPPGRLIEISVNWPARLDGTCPLQFVAVGRVLRSE